MKTSQIVKKYQISLTGVSGIGKSSIINILMNKYNFAFSVSTTTRLKRPGEEDGVHYDFVTVEQFKQMIKDDLFIEHTLYADNYYGTPIAQLYKNDDKHIVFDLDPAVSSFDRPEMAQVVRVLLEHDDKEVIKQRLISRFAEGDVNASLKARLDQIDNRVYDKELYDICVNVTGKTPEEIASEIILMLDNKSS